MTELNALDRCDACGAQAWVAVQNANHGSLLFCVHHYQSNSILLHAQGWEISQDEREKMNVKPSQSSA